MSGRALRFLTEAQDWKQVDASWLYVAFMVGLMFGVFLGIWG